MKQQSRTVPRRRQSVSPTPRHLPLVDILIDTQAELQELVVASGLKVLEAMLEEDRAAVCGPRYAHQPARQAYRTGHTPSQVVLGGRKVAIRRPRARRAGEEVPLPTARAFANADPLNRRVVDQMLIGVATRQDARSLEPLGADVTTRGTSKRAVSRRFVAQTQAQLDAWRATPLDALDLVGLLIDGVHVGGHCIVVALGIDKMGAKHPLGLWEGATENATVCQGLLTDLGSRGLRTDRSLLVIVDGAKALDTAVTQTFGRAALVQRCQVHKGRNILEHLPEAQRPWVKAVLTPRRMLSVPRASPPEYNDGCATDFRVALERLVVVDVHTGLGRFGRDTVLVSAADEGTALFASLRETFGDPVRSTDPRRGPAYRVRGAYDDLYPRALPQATVHFVAQEFGTYRAVRVLSALRAENRWHHYGAGSIDHRTKRDLAEVFAPADESWRSAVLRRGRVVIGQALALGTAPTTDTKRTPRG